MYWTDILYSTLSIQHRDIFYHFFKKYAITENPYCIETKTSQNPHRISVTSRVSNKIKRNTASTVHYNQHTICHSQRITASANSHYTIVPQSDAAAGTVAGSALPGHPVPAGERTRLGAGVRSYIGHNGVLPSKPRQAAAKLLPSHGLSMLMLTKRDR